jgi:ketosteroid isomerase-like protein
VAKTFADDAVAAVAGQPTATGTDAIQDVFKKQIDRPGNHAQATHNIDEARMAGDNDAIVRSTSKVGDKNMRELFVVSKDGGEWKISRFMNNNAS